MRKSLLIVTAAAATTGSAAAIAAAAISAPAPVTAIAAAQGKVAYATAWSRPRCERVVLGRSSYGPRPCPEVSTGRGVAAVQLAGTRVLWLGYAGGNLRDWLVETATPTSPRPRQLLFVEQDVELPSPVQLGPTDGSLLAYNRGRTVVALRANGSRAFAWVSPSEVTALAVAGERVAVAQRNGQVALVAAGKVVRTVETGGAPSAVAISGDAVVVQVGQVLSRRTAAPGAGHGVALPKGAHLEDADATRAVYVAAGKAHLVTLATGEDAVIGAAQHAQLDGRRLVLANGRTIVVKAL